MSSSLEDEIERLKLELRLKDEELELAAELGQALIRKDTQQSMQLEKFNAKLQTAEEEVSKLKAENETLKHGQVIGEADEDFINKIHELEETNAKLNYELKRLKLQYDYACKINAKTESEEASKKNAEVEIKETEIKELKSMHEQELECIRKSSEEKIQQFLKASQGETERLVQGMEHQIETLRQQLQEQQKKADEAPEDFSLLSPIHKSAHNGSFHDESLMSFGSKFSTETLDLDLCLDDEGADLNTSRSILDDSMDISFSALTTDTPKRVPRELSTRGAAAPPPVPTRPKLAPPALNVTKVSIVENKTSNTNVIAMVTKHQCKREEEGKKAPELVAPSENERPLESAEGKLEEKSLRELKQMQQQQKQSIKPTPHNKTKKLQSRRSATEDEVEDEMSNMSMDAVENDLKPQLRLSPTSKRGKKFSKDWQDTNWADAMKGRLPVKFSAIRRNEKWSLRYVVFVNSLLYVFRSESDAQKYASKDNNAAKPVKVVKMNQTELRVVRRPNAQDDSENADARNSMLAWLRKRSSDSQEASTLHSNKKKMRPDFKLQLVEHDLNDLSLQDSCDIDCDTSISSASVGFTTLSGTRNKHNLTIGFCTEADRTLWSELFMRESHAVQVDAGSVWIKAKGKKKGDQWIKRYAVVRPAKLELHDYESEIIRETVSLSSVKVEPAYSSHIFLSHKQHQKQLITIRAYDGAERNWWVAAIRACCSRKDIMAA